MQRRALRGRQFNAASMRQRQIASSPSMAWRSFHSDSHVDVSPDPFDNYLLAIAQAGQADFLVSGDRRDLLESGQFGACRIVTTQEILARWA
jgi:predicted nucleic acid-binding protein